MTRTWLAMISVASGCAVATPALADIINVPGDYRTIQAGIDAAVDGDEVVVADGVWTGDGNRDMSFGGKAITVRSENGPAACIIDLQADENDPHRAFNFENDETAASVLEGFTIRNGFMDDSGAIRIWMAEPTIRRCIFKNNQVINGGGAVSVVMYSTPLFRSCVFRHNRGSFAGAVYNWGADTTFIGCQFIENHAELGGGAVTTTSGCEAGAGCSRPEFYGCLFSGNTATDPESSVGGAAYVFNSSSPEFVNCMFVGNQAHHGGALGAAGFHARVIVVNCTFVGNQADQGGAVWHDSNRTASAELHNSILWDNSPEQIGGGRVSVHYSDVQGGWEGEGNIDADPLFVDPDNGDFRLSPNSPCIDAADNASVPVDLTVDLDGNPRFADDPDTEDTGMGDCPVVDMGAYEFQAEGDCPCVRDPEWQCDGDVDADGQVNPVDSGLVQAAFGSTDESDLCQYDIDCDGQINPVDSGIVQSLFGTCDPPRAGCP